MTPIPELFISQVQDQYSRENFKKLKAFLLEGISLDNFKLFEIQFTRGESNHKLIHNLGFLPKDILLCSKSDGVTVTFNQNLTTVDSIDMTVSAAGTVRFIAGNF